VPPGGTGGIPGGSGIRSGVGCFSRSGGGSPVPVHLKHVYGFCAVPFCKKGSRLFDFHER